MKKLCFIIVTCFCTVISLQAQEFGVSFKNKQLQILAGNELKTECIITVPQGFSASVFLSITSPTLAINDNALKLKIVNIPFPQAVGISFKPLISDTGIHKIYITASNESLVSHDTLTLAIVKSDQWRTYTNQYGTQNFAIYSDSVVYFTTLYRSKFLGKISNNTITYQPGWNYMEMLGAPTTKSPMFVDKNLHIWTGSQAGIGKYDGSFWTVYPNEATNLALQRMTMDKSGKVWYYSDYYGAPNRSSRLGYVVNGVNTQADNIIRQMPDFKTGYGLFGMNADINGNIWIIAQPYSDYSITSHRLLRFNGLQWERINYPNDSTENYYNTNTLLNEIAIDKNNNLWTWQSVKKPLPAIDQSSLLKYNGSTWEEFLSPYNGQPINMAIDSKGIAWIQFSNSLVSFDGSEWKKFNSENSPIPSSYSAKSMNIDFNDNLWMIWDNKILVFNPENITGMQMAFNALTDINENYSLTNGFTTIASPNPTQNSTTIHYSLKTESPVSLFIYNSLGIEVFKNNLGFKNAGDNSETMSTSELPTGQYYYVLKAGAQQITHPLVIVR